MYGDVFRRIYDGAKNCKYRSLILGMLLGSMVLSAVLLISDGRAAAKPVTSIARNSYGKGSITRELQLVLDGVRQKESVDITIQEQVYQEEKLKEIFSNESESLAERVLGKNQDLDHVQYDLELISAIPDQPIRVEWETDRYDLISVQGVLNTENLKNETEGVLVHLKACLIYTQDETEQVITELAARLYPPYEDEADKAAAEVSEAVREEEERTRKETALVVPETVSGKSVEFYDPYNPRGWYVLGLGVIMCILLVLLDRQNRQKEQAERQRQMMLDYPEITDKLTLLLGAGITVKTAWQKIVSDYEKQKEKRGVRYAYEEMVRACHEMQSGVTEAEAYEAFGRRCGLKTYRKLAALLTQNLRRGTKGVSELLRGEAEQAFEERKAAAKRQGEEAGTKLLLPMFLMLAMVLVIVIVPAFLSLQM